MEFVTRCAALVATATVLLGGAAGTAAAERDEPVPYSYLAGLAAQAAAPGQPPPGANDWSCRPNERHPRPVVLLHGLGNETVTWQTLSPLLARSGYCVFTTTYGTGALGPAVGALAPVERSAAEIGAFIDRVRTATGAARVDVVGHSMGAAVPFFYMHHLDGASTIARLIGLGGPFHGTTVSGLAMLGDRVRDLPDAAAIVADCGPCQMSPGSPMIDLLRADPRLLPDTEFVGIVSRYDEIATPYTTGLLEGPNARSVVLQDVCATDFSEHYGLTSDPVAVAEVINALDPERARPVDCTVVAPLLGPLAPPVEHGGVR
ncbi:alpha/beta fold hydrolase [Nocardia otitidiscaviarum]|uniref:alpha/beta fold hydrolase n=1 Tax=Nocardia otitidiscaviarum TaxID=1823 RepID=UPI00163D5AC6|nr:alpha/beta fold hydrolase [Nocardia otitidiscaviarum]MCP9619525.1 alpha/beta fold hydrolase [Nocardia otitidiscaviarum]